MGTQLLAVLTPVTGLHLFHVLCPEVLGQEEVQILEHSPVVPQVASVPSLKSHAGWMLTSAMPRMHPSLSMTNQHALMPKDNILRLTPFASRICRMQQKIATFSPVVVFEQKATAFMPVGCRMSASMYNLPAL